MNDAYNFTALSPKDFEDLLSDILSAKFDCHFETFRAGIDGGIDVRGSPSENMVIIGQAKHFAGSSFSDLKKACRKEANRKDTIADKCQRYILATTQPLNDSQKQDLLDIFDGFPTRSADIWGRDDIASLIRRFPSVERSHFKLWMTGTATLGRLIHGRLFNQSEGETETIEEELCRFVRHKGVENAYKILRKYGVLFVSGPPGIGKTTLARMICALHISEGWEFSVGYSVEEVGDALGIGGQRIILFDDFLGQVRLSDYLLHEVDSRLPSQILRATKSEKTRLVITTRDYILGSAQTRSEKLLRSIGEDETYVLSLERYSYLDRARILYNHLYFSNLSQEHIDVFLKGKFYEKVVRHVNYNPRLVETITGEDYIALGETEFRQKIEEVLDRPELLWAIPYREHISEASQLLVLAVAISSWRSFKGITVDNVEKSFAQLNDRLDFSIKPHRLKPAFRSAVKQMEGSFIAIANGQISLTNPGVRDFIESVILEDGWFEILLASCDSTFELHYLKNLQKGGFCNYPDLSLNALKRIFNPDMEFSLYELSNVLSFLRAIDSEIKHKSLQEFLNSCAKSYAERPTIYGELDGAKEVMKAIDNGYIEEPHAAIILENITNEFEEHLKDQSFSTDDAEWAISIFYDVSCTTHDMKDKVSNVIELALDNDSPDFGEMSEGDIVSRKEIIENLENYMTYPFGGFESASQKYIDKLREIYYQQDEEYADGYYPSRNLENSKSSSDRRPSEIPLNDEEEAAAMFNSLKRK